MKQFLIFAALFLISFQSYCEYRFDELFIQINVKNRWGRKEICYAVKSNSHLDRLLKKGTKDTQNSLSSESLCNGRQNGMLLRPAIVIIQKRYTVDELWKLAEVIKTHIICCDATICTGMNNEPPIYFCVCTWKNRGQHVMNLVITTEIQL